MTDRTTLQVPAEPVRSLLEVRKSKFICTLDYIDDAVEVKPLIESLAVEFPTANHHCWAFQIGATNSLIQGCSDDGEPHGTAGRPMLNQLQHSGISHVVAVVTRIFGGVKLGTGGLVRAYSDAVAQALAQLKTRDMVHWQRLVLTMDFELESAVRHMLSDFTCQQVEVDYRHQVHMSLACAQAESALLERRLSELSAGRILFELVE